jgi:hypothetical protein
VVSAPDPKTRPKLVPEIQVPSLRSVTRRAAKSEEARRAKAQAGPSSIRSSVVSDALDREYRAEMTKVEHQYRRELDILATRYKSEVELTKAKFETILRSLAVTFQAVPATLSGISSGAPSASEEEEDAAYTDDGSDGPDDEEEDAGEEEYVPSRTGKEKAREPRYSKRK